MSLRACSETRWWPAPEQAARGGGPSGEQSPRRGAAPLRTRTRYQKRRTALSLPNSLAFTAPFVSLPRGGKVGAMGSRPQSLNHLFQARPSPAAGVQGLFPSLPVARSCTRLGARGQTRGNFDSRELIFPPRWPWEARHSLHFPPPFLDPRHASALVFPPRKESGFGIGRISRIFHCPSLGVGIQSSPLLRSGSPFGQWNGWGAPPPRMGNGVWGT